MRKSKIWRGYFFVFVVVTLVACALPFFASSMPRNELMFPHYEWLAIAISALALLGLGAYVFSRRFGSRHIWTFVLALSIMFELFSGYLDSRIIGAEVMDTGERIFAISLLLLAYLIYVPLWLALYRRAWPETKLVERSL